jgi:adenosine deaminase
MMEQGLLVSLNSDDPAYFGGYVSENLIACRDALGLSVDEIATLARNGFLAAFLPPEEAARGLAAVAAHLSDNARAGDETGPPLSPRRAMGY